MRREKTRFACVACISDITFSDGVQQEREREKRRKMLLPTSLRTPAWGHVRRRVAHSYLFINTRASTSECVFVCALKVHIRTLSLSDTLQGTMNLGRCAALSRTETLPACVGNNFASVNCYIFTVKSKLGRFSFGVCKLNWQRVNLI